MNPYITPEELKRIAALAVKRAQSLMNGELPQNAGFWCMHMYMTCISRGKNVIMDCLVIAEMVFRLRKLGLIPRANLSVLLYRKQRKLTRPLELLCHPLSMVFVELSQAGYLQCL